MPWLCSVPFELVLYKCIENTLYLFQRAYPMNGLISLSGFSIMSLLLGVFSHTKENSSHLIYPQKSMGYTRAGLYLSQAAEMTVWFYSNQILMGLSQIHTSFFFLYLPWDLRSVVLLFHLVLKVLYLTGPCHFTLHCPCRGLQALNRCTLLLLDQHQPCKTYSLNPSTLPQLTTARFQEFLIFIISHFIIPMRTTFPVCKRTPVLQQTQAQMTYVLFPCSALKFSALRPIIGCVTPDKYLFTELHFLMQVPGECIKIQSLEF